MARAIEKASDALLEPLLFGQQPLDEQHALGGRELGVIAQDLRDRPDGGERREQLVLAIRRERIETVAGRAVGTGQEATLRVEVRSDGSR